MSRRAMTRHEAVEMHLRSRSHPPARAVGIQVVAVAAAEDAALLAPPPCAPAGHTETRHAGGRFVFHVELAR